MQTKKGITSNTDFKFSHCKKVGDNVRKPLEADKRGDAFVSRWNFVQQLHFTKLPYHTDDRKAESNVTQRSVTFMKLSFLHKCLKDDQFRA